MIYVADTADGIIGALHYNQSDYELINLGNIERSGNPLLCAPQFNHKFYSF